MGGHRFFTKVEEVKKMWHEVLGDDFLRRLGCRGSTTTASSSIPLKPLNALSGSGIWQRLVILLSYIRWQRSPTAARRRSSSG